MFCLNLSSTKRFSTLSRAMINSQTIEEKPEPGVPRVGRPLWEFFYSAFLRVLAVFFLVATIQVWMQAIGISSDPQLRFDTMATHWRLAIAVLCVLHPITALGLWGLFSWGVVVWLIGILVQINMYLIFSNLYGSDNLLILFHLICFLIFVIFQIAMRIIDNKA